MVVTMMLGVYIRRELAAIRDLGWVQVHPMTVMPVGDECCPIEATEHEQGNEQNDRKPRSGVPPPGAEGRVREDCETNLMHG